MCWRRQWHPTPVLLPGKSHGRRSLVAYSPWGRWELDMTEWLHFHFSLSCTGEGNGNPLQCSCLENPRDRGAWWAAVYGVAESDTTEATAAAANDVLSVEHLVGDRLETRTLHPNLYIFYYFIPLYLCEKWDTHLYQTCFLITYTIYQAQV